LTVKVIIDKISKRSKGYAFIEYTTEEAASAALKKMNGKVDPSFFHACKMQFCFALVLFRDCHVGRKRIWVYKS